MKRFLRSVGYCVNGLVHAARTEPNIRCQFVVGMIVIASGFVLGIDLDQWAIVIGCIGAVLAMECVNTAIERLADRVTTDPDPLIKQAKDTAASAVLVTSIAATAIGVVVFGPKLLSFAELTARHLKVF